MVLAAATLCGTQVIGLDLETVQEAFAEFIEDSTLTRAQLHLINLIVKHLTQNGVMDVGALYDAPFSDIAPTGPEGIFPEERVGDIVSLIERLNLSARLQKSTGIA